ncbi:hypothetical protein BTVI_38922 [Pitangus sulphuratus]|nr:hypothetical protein BTVI_38922 [Pitangus sulphuratus]
MSLSLPPVQPHYPDCMVGEEPSLLVAQPSCADHTAGGYPSLLVARQICNTPMADADSDDPEGNDMVGDPGEGLVTVALNEERCVDANLYARNWNRCQEETIKSGDWKILHACPVVYRPQQNPQFQGLPHEGMQNSPTICQTVVAKAIRPVWELYLSAIIYHYVDDILVAAAQETDLPPIMTALTNAVQEAGLQIAPEKIQRTQP